MLVMGINASPFKTHEDGSAYIERGQFHDSAAVLLDNGEVVAAIEQERLNRIKHTNKFPAEAIKYCLESYGAKIQDLDYLAYGGRESNLNAFIKQLNTTRTLENQIFEEHWDARSLLQKLLSSEFNYSIPLEKFVFADHHYSHALSAFLPSSFDESLILTLDGQGDNESGRVMIGNKSSLGVLASFPVPISLGHAYTNIINVVGFQYFEEYKAMGLAPYGDSTRFRDVLRACYTLLPDGNYILDPNGLHKIHNMMTPRKRREEFNQDHKDLMAALQESLEEVVFHILTYYRHKTGQCNLCFAGGVGHNSVLNGKIIDSKLFDRVFIQPASHDAGTAYGAALTVYHNNDPEIKIKPLKHVYWGKDIGDNEAILATLTPWRELLSFQKVDDIYHRIAKLIVDGNVVGWVQGRSEFGPRALGNRSILADPRPAENKEIINAIIKKREAFRPFAPSVLEEYAEEFFEINSSRRNYSYMNIVVKVRPEKRKLLGAVTHVDGTARLQTVSKEINERYWRLIDAFNESTGIPVLLNTSFNNSVEPIIDSIEDAITCFLTTEIHYLVIGDWLVNKRPITTARYLTLAPALPKYMTIAKVKKRDSTGQPAILYECRNNYDSFYKHEMSSEIFELLIKADGHTALEELMANRHIEKNSNAEELCQELHSLWSRRIIVLRPSIQYKK